MKVFSVVCIVATCSLLACSKDSHSSALVNGTGSNGEAIVSYDSVPTVVTVNVAAIKEASGIADSKANPGYLWVEEDSGNPTRLFLLSHDGKQARSVHLDGVTNRDWEDLTLAPGPEKNVNYIYLSDMGDNQQVYKTYAIYRFPEPAAGKDTVKSIDKIELVYPDGSHDSEGFLVDPITKDIFVLTKRDSVAFVYRLAYPYSTQSVNTLQKVGALGYSGVVSAAITADGKGIVVKTYVGLSYYSRADNQTVAEALAEKPQSLPYVLEPQGEAVCFSADSSGYYTLSEKGFGSSVKLYYYKKK